MIAGAHATVTVTDVDGERSLVYTMFGGRSALLSRITPIATSATYDAVPAARLPAGIAQTLSIEDVDGPPLEQRRVDIDFRDVVDRTVTVGPRLADPTVSIRVAGPYAFPTVELPLQPEYGRWMEADFTTGPDFMTGGGVAAISVLFTVEYFGPWPPPGWQRFPI